MSTGKPLSDGALRGLCLGLAEANKQRVDELAKTGSVEAQENLAVAIDELLENPAQAADAVTLVRRLQADLAAVSELVAAHRNRYPVPAECMPCSRPLWGRGGSSSWQWPTDELCRACGHADRVALRYVEVRGVQGWVTWDQGLELRFYGMEVLEGSLADLERQGPRAIPRGGYRGGVALELDNFGVLDVLVGPLLAPPGEDTGAVLTLWSERIL